ncbi:MAG: alpha-2-macroglobulin family protein [Flavobacterium sp.]
MKSQSLLFLFAFSLFFSCKSDAEKDFEVSDPSKFVAYIQNFTSGIVSNKASFQVQLNFDLKNAEINGFLPNDVFEISPAVEGKVKVISKNSFAFVPNKQLPQNTTFLVTLHLGKLTKTPRELSVFKYKIKTIAQDFLVNTTDLQSHDKNWNYLNGTIETSDYLDFETVKKLVTATQNNKDLKIKWRKELSSEKHFKFYIDSIERKIEDENIQIAWNGEPFDIKQKGSMDFLIPGKNNFKIISIEPAAENNQSIRINFSDPIKKGQDLKGLVAIENYSELKYYIEGNLLKVFSAEPYKGNLLVEVFQGIENEDGFKMKQNYSERVSFEQTKPEARWVKNGVILPSSSQMRINLELVNLKAFDVKIYRIFENNVLQFLQSNDLDGYYNLTEVALPVVEKTIRVGQQKLNAQDRWHAYSLDLSSIFKPEPGAIYRIEVSFKKDYSLYVCEELATETSEDEEEDEYDEYGYYRDYDWRERDNPCHNTYYYERKIATNVLATDLGVIAKKEQGGLFHFTVANIITTEPIANAGVTIYNYQQQKIGNGKTNEEGFAKIQSTDDAYFAIVSSEKQKTYVKINPGNALGISSFDVSGQSLQKGLKGYVYGERGVWRPGDTLFIGFILNDQKQKLEEKHPIKLRIHDPNGKIVHQEVQKYNAQNHYKFIVPTKSDDPTGNWEALVNVGGAKFYKSLKIETIKPNRLKIKYKTESKTIKSGQENKAEMQVNWLHGAVAKNLKVEVSAKYRAQKTSFDGFPNYDFDDLTRSFESEETSIFKGEVNENGKTSFVINPKPTTQAPGMLQAAFMTKVFENGGDFSTDVMSMAYSPYNSYVGILTPKPNKYDMLETGKANRYEVVALSQDGKTLKNKKVEVEVYKVRWRWWWESYEENLSNYYASDETTAYKNYNLVTDATGKAHFVMKVDNEDWGRYLIRVVDEESGHAASKTVLIDWPYSSSNTKNVDSEHASRLIFSTDKKSYQVGETAKISFPSSENARALVSIENGTEVLQSFWVKTNKRETLVNLKITPEMAPNVYVNISLIQPHANTINDLPIRMYGIVPIEIIDKNTLLSPEIIMPEVLRPQQKSTIKIKEKNGKKMSYTLAIVDEGLLDLTRFATPNAWHSFYSKESLGVKTWDIYDEVIGAYGGKINQILSVGGDEDLGGANAKKANRFKPVVIYLGPFTLEAGKTKAHQINLPKYIGAVRVMVVAANNATSAYGNAEKSVPVKSPLMVLASAPRKATTGEKIKLPVTVFGMEPSVKNVSIQIKTNGALKTIGETTQKLTFSEPDEKMVYFELEVGQILGKATIDILASSGKEKANYSIEMDVTNPNPLTQTTQDFVLEANSSQKITFETFGIKGSNAALLEISNFPTIDLNRRLQYLIAYPHGCLEQTTSAVFPQLYLNELVTISTQKKTEIEKNIKAAIQKIGKQQLSSGGLQYWPNQTYADDWGSTYAGHFMIEAEKKGYVLPIQFKSKWLTYQQKAARQWRFESQTQSELAQAYRLYTLALAGKPDLGAMNRLRETKGISNESKLRLAAAYALAGQKTAGLQLMNTAALVPQTYNQYEYYGSFERNLAMMLETFVALDSKQKSFEASKKIAEALSNNEWMSTQTTAFCLNAMAKFAKKSGNAPIQFEWTSNNKTETSTTNKNILNQPLAIKTGNNEVSIKNPTSQTLYVRLVKSGILPVGNEKVTQGKLVARVKYLHKDESPASLSKILQGTALIAEITITNNSGYFVKDVALSHIIPSGFEIITSRFTEFGENDRNAAQYTDIRDDRTLFYMTLKANETKTFNVLLNASYLGSYYLPGLQAEAMYDNSYLARTKGEWIEIIK